MLVNILLILAVNVAVSAGAACLSNSRDGIVKISGEKAGTFTSPNFPNATHPNMTCGWQLTAPNNSLIQLFVRIYHKNGDPNCSKESLTFYDGTDPSGKILFEFCKRVLTSFTIYPSGSVIFVQLKTSLGSDGTKLRIDYNAVPQNADSGCSFGNVMSERTIQVTKQSVSLSSPFGSFDLPVGWQCNWRIEAPQGYVLKLKFESRSFFDTPYCYRTTFENYTSYKIYNSNETDSETLVPCGVLDGLGSDPLYLPGRYLYIQLKARKDWTFGKHYLKFKLVFEPVSHGSTCSTSNSAIKNANIILEGESGTIISPGFPLNQPSNLKCAWKITVPRDNAIKLEFISFKLGRWLHFNNKVEVYSDFFKLRSALLDERQAKPSFVSFSPTRFALVELDLEDKVSGEYGMKLNYKQVPQLKSDDCNSGQGATIEVSGREGVFISPENYSSKKICRWNITVPKGYVVKIHLHRTLGDKCKSNDKIYDGNSQASKVLSDLCLDTFAPVFSGSRHALVEFKGIDQNGQLQGFYEAVKSKPFPFSCQGSKKNTLLASSGGIASYNYPLPYPNGVYCKWEIKVALRKLVKLSFKNFSLEESKNCEKDYLWINGNTLPGFQELELCGSVKPPDIISIDNEMELIFRSNIVGRFGGFEAAYEAIDDKTWGSCSTEGVELNQPTGHFSSPRYPGFFPPGVNCEWKITAPEGQHIRLKIKTRTMPYSCKTASISIYGGSNVTRKLVKKVCDSLDPPVLFSTGSHFWVHFRVAPGSKSYYRGFNATYEIVRTMPHSAACSSTNKFITLEGASGSLASDGYPNDYSNDAECSFKLKSANSLNAIMLTFESFDLESSKGCEADYVEVYDSSFAFGESMGRFCGSTTPEPLTSSGQYMVVKFKTNSNGRYPGFSASFSTKLSTKYTIIIAVSSTLGAIFVIIACCWVCKRLCSDNGNKLGGGDFSGVPMVDIKENA